ncbi:PREDICTED: tektin-2-like [Priapulus caudatus]|uniref:Tektin n=1 Tax=Priapulus caudatus TaxID=37621 RepID=A0ABM1EPJ6_PRICU|nr:PREDICTED: tektin-2-like [Priapulus caudatus]
MSTRLEKPSMRFTVPDWHTANMTMVASGEQQRGKSRQCREEARQMQNEAEITSKWDQQENTTRLAQRVGDIEYWKNTLEKCLSDIDSEIASLSEAKHHTENALEAMAVPLDVALECLTLREGREGTDIVADGVEDQLNTEVQVIAQAKQQLQQRCREGFEKLIQLQEARQQVVLDLQAEAPSIEAMLLKTQLRWAGHVSRIKDQRLPKIVLYGSRAVIWKPQLRGTKEEVQRQSQVFPQCLPHRPHHWPTLAADREG